MSNNLCFQILAASRMSCNTGYPPWQQPQTSQPDTAGYIKVWYHKRPSHIDSPVLVLSVQEKNLLIEMSVVHQCHPAQGLGLQPCKTGDLQPHFNQQVASLIVSQPSQAHHRQISEDNVKFVVGFGPNTASLILHLLGNRNNPDSNKHSLSMLGK